MCCACAAATCASSAARAASNCARSADGLFLRLQARGVEIALRRLPGFQPGLIGGARGFRAGDFPDLVDGLIEDGVGVRDARFEHPDPFVEGGAQGVEVAAKRLPNAVGRGVDRRTYLIDQRVV